MDNTSGVVKLESPGTFDKLWLLICINDLCDMNFFRDEKSKEIFSQDKQALTSDPFYCFILLSTDVFVTYVVFVFFPLTYN